MVSFDWTPIINTTYYALIPAIILFIVGWFFGAIDLIESAHVGAINRYCLFFSIPVVVFNSFVTGIVDVKTLYFVIVCVAYQASCAVLFALPFIFTKKWRIDIFVMVYVNATYVNNIIYGNNFLMFLYPGHHMDFYCALSSLTDSVVAFTFSVFMLELRKLLLKQEEERKGKKNFVCTQGGIIEEKETKLTFQGCLKLIVRILARIPFQPVIWGIVLGIIVNILVKRRGKEMNSVVTYVINMISGSNLPIAMFNIGLFTAHSPSLHINFPKHWKTLKRKLFKRDEEHDIHNPQGGPINLSETHYMEDVERERGEGFTKGKSKEEEQQQQQQQEEEEEQKQRRENYNIIVEEGREEGGGEREELMDGELNRPLLRLRGEEDEQHYVQSFPPSYPSSSLFPPPSSYPPPSYPSSSFPPSSSSVVVSQPEKEPPISWWLCVSLAVVKALSPALMLCITLVFHIFSGFLTDEHYIALVMNPTLPIALVAFALAKEFNSLAQEAVITIVSQSFILCFPLIVLWSKVVDLIYVMPPVDDF